MYLDNWLADGCVTRRWSIKVTLPKKKKTALHAMLLDRNLCFTRQVLELPLRLVFKYFA